MDSAQRSGKERLKMDKTENENRPAATKKQQIPTPIKTNITISGGAVESLKSATLTTPSTPRIELSRASSSSHHEDSRDSSPDNVFEQVGTGTLQDTIGIGFSEEGALELRSSTEELFFMDPEAKKEEQEKLLQQQQLQQARRSSPIIFKFDEHQNYLQHHQRKDSASSEVAALLCISGRTSRVSSVGSQGSAVSRLSAISGVSRSPSPHRMLLETSFCGPKPMENIVDGSTASAVEQPSTEALEQVLLSRKHDPTQAVFAEGIKIESSPQKKKPPTSITTNGDAVKRKPTDIKRASRQTSSNSSKTMSSRQANRLTANKSPGQLVVGKTPSGSEYIRINLKPDHMYKDKGVGPNERVVEAAGSEKTSHHKKPISLSLGRNSAIDEKKLTPSLSPKPSRHSALSKEGGPGSRSPSPANVSVSRKSSFCSLFKLKDSPDSPKDRVRSRSKSRDRSTPQSQNPTPNKQKSVLAIFKPKREGKSKSSSPIDFDFERHTPTGRQVPFDSALETFQSGGSRPSSRLRYYDKPVDGKGIHIPLHTPPEEKNINKLLQESQSEARPQSAPTLKGSLASSHSISAVKSKPNDVSTTPQQKQHQETPAATIKPPELNKDKEVTSASIAPSPTPASTQNQQQPQQNKANKIQHIENLDAIHTLPQDVDEKEQTWSLEVHHHSSQDSQDTILSDNCLPNNCNSKLGPTRPNLENVSEHIIDENGIAAEVHRVPSETESIPSQAQQVPEESMGREKRRILFATRLGSGSQEQMFSTQFSLSKTESLSSQLSEQASIPENSVQEHLQRKDTILRRPDDKTSIAHKPETLRKSASVSKSQSTSEDEKPAPVAAAILLRKKDPTHDDVRRSKSSRSASEDDDVATHRHSRYLENFDVRRKLHENLPAKPGAVILQTQEEPKEEEEEAEVEFKAEYPALDAEHAPEPEMQADVQERIVEQDVAIDTPKKPVSTVIPRSSGKPIYVPAGRQSFISTDEPWSSESERDSEADPHRLKRILAHHVAHLEDNESTGLVSQDSFDDELPYIPTTLPEERAHGVALIPMKERLHMELKTCPLDRPRSTTPLNPSHLEEYCGIVVPDTNTAAISTAAGGEFEQRQLVRGEKLRISLPRKDSAKDKAQKSKSPRRTSTSSGKSWFEFAEEAIRGPTTTTTTTTTTTDTNKLASIPKPQPDESQISAQTAQAAAIAVAETPTSISNSITSARKLSDQWIDFQNIPEKRKTPKRITTLPKDTLADNNKTMVVHYNYVKPEDCQCECHEVERDMTHKSIASVDLLNPNREDMQPLLEPEPLDSIDPSDSSREYSCYTDDENDGARTSQVQSEEFPLRGLHNPRNTKFPDNRYS